MKTTLEIDEDLLRQAKEALGAATEWILLELMTGLSRSEDGQSLLGQFSAVAMESAIPLIHSDADFEAMRRYSALQTIDWTVHL